MNLNVSNEVVVQLSQTGFLLAGAAITRIVGEIFIKEIVKKFEDDNPDEISATEQRLYTLTSILRSTINILIIAITILMVMSVWGIDITPILTGAGVLGLAIGFGSQQLVKDVVTGFFILLENTYNVGDRIEVSGVKGKVLEMKIRTTILKDKDGNVHTIPNSHISKIKKEQI